MHRIFHIQCSREILVGMLDHQKLCAPEVTIGGGDFSLRATKASGRLLGVDLSEDKGEGENVRASGETKDDQ